MLDDNKMDQRYKKLEKIGQGTFGKVYKCKDNETGEIVAIKKILFYVIVRRHILYHMVGLKST